MAVWTPAKINTLAWYDPADSATVTIDTGVSLLQDKSGNGNNASQAISARQPAMGSLNGLDVLEFDGADDCLVFNLGMSVTDDTVYIMLFNRVAAASNSIPLGGTQVNAPPCPFWWYTDRIIYGGLQAAGWLNFISSSQTGWCIATVTRSGATATLRINGTEKKVMAASGLPVNPLMYIGRIGSDYHSGGMAEIVIVENDVQNIEKIEGYIAWRYGLAAHLPPDHPYYAAAPVIADGIWSPIEMNTALFLDASQHIYKDEVTATLARLNDQTGYGRHLLTEDGYRPVISGDRIVFTGNEFAATRSNGVGRNVTGLAMFAVVKSGSSAEQIVQAVTARFTDIMAGIIINASGHSGQWCAAGRFTPTDNLVVTPLGTFTTDTDTLVFAYWDFTSGQTGGAINGADPTSVPLGATGTTIDSLRGFSLGGFQSGKRGFSGSWAATVAFDFVPTEAQRQKIEGYLAHTYGLTASLPGNHPYHTTPPASTGTTYNVTVVYDQPVIDLSKEMIVSVEGCTGPEHKHYLGGKVTVDGSPARKRVVVCDRVTLEYLAVTESDAGTGEWQISHLPEYDERSLLVLAFDDAGNFNAEVADFVTQVASKQGG